MDHNDNNKADSFSAAFPLPGDDRMQLQAKEEQPQAEPNPAVDLIRKRVEAAYGQEPSAPQEATDIKSAGDQTRLSKHQKFITELTSSGKSLADIQIAWHEYYAALTDLEKYQVWQEFYEAHAATAPAGAVAPSLAPDQLFHGPKRRAPKPRAQRGHAPKPWQDLAGQVVKLTKVRPGKAHLKSLLFGLGTGVLVLLIVLFSFFNERFIAPLIQPSRNASNIPLISSTGAVGPNPEIIIPKINVEIPVVYGVDTIDENAVDNALEGGVVHYADTALPGQDGNLVIVGHSSNNIFNKGRYKFAFVLLSRLDSGDTFYLQKDGKRYTYQIYKKEIVSPTDVSVLGTEDKAATATLITCDPPGTSINRLVVVGEQIDPSPDNNIAASGQNAVATSSKIIPSNAPSLWSRLIHAL